MQEFWDKRYNEAEYAYGTAPNTFLAAIWPTLPAQGRALCLAEGEGRNAVFVAQQGWSVVATDFSAVARQKAEKLAHTEGVAFEDYWVSEATAWTFPDNSFDAIVLIYAHFPPHLRSTIHQQCCRWLRPNGHLILEAFGTAQTQHTSGGPKDPTWLYEIELLKQDFNQLEPLMAIETTTELSEGAYHQGAAAIVRFLGKKAANPLL